MSRYSGRHGSGAARTARATRRTEAETRNAQTPPERTAHWRREKARVRSVLTEDERARLSAALAEPQPTGGAA